MLEMRDTCERCEAPLPPSSDAARICSFECTFCAECADEMDERCPNCGGELMDRPSRVGAALKKHPASAERKFKG